MVEAIPNMERPNAPIEEPTQDERDLIDTPNEEPIQDECDLVSDRNLKGLRYEYSRLLYFDSIRIFLLFPSSDATAPIRGQIVERRLLNGRTGQKYTTLSYAWGLQHNTVEICIGDRRLRVGRNLHSALWNIRQHNRTIMLWVDAICINQDDVNERNHQVQQMRRIYSSATETIIYVGGQTGSNTECSAWNFLERNATWALNHDGNEDPDRPKRKEALVDFRGDLSDVEIDVLRRPWFRRLWVFQEVVVSKRLLIRCGKRSISWDDFCKILLLSPRHHDRYGLSIERLNQVEVVRNMFQARCTYQKLCGMDHLLPSWRSQLQTLEHDTLDILNLLQMAGPLQASDPRDKIFGLLGVCSGIDVDDPRFAINYYQDCRSVYTKFARQIMDVANNYDILSYVEHNGIHHYHGLPSWVPNWDLRPEDPDNGIKRPLRSRRTILSTLDSESHMEQLEREQLFKRSCSWINYGKTLVAFGSLIGKIESLSLLIELNQSAEMKFQAIRDLGCLENDTQYLIMAHWHHRLSHDGIFPSEVRFEHMANNRSMIAHERFGDSPSFSDLLAKCRSLNASGATRRFEKGTVEYHLLARSRKTISSNKNPSELSTFIVDEASIVDGKCVAIYRLFGAPHVLALALVPASTRYGDYLIDLRGGRVPFTVRYNSVGISEKWNDVDIDFGIRDCRLIGESVVNRVVVDGLPWRDRIFVME
ncbi:heterokaryon incompatibility protein-domain-containing protein [Xylaria telfairii]|nr:heterokaryon incompatibility protein-domain-containing protein [Xylaria telfairii]